MIQHRTDVAAKVLTTGQIARICHVAPRTVSKWFDMGQLRGYRIPGSRDRRVPIDQLIRFMKTHNMPLNGLDAGPRRVLLMHRDVEFSQTVMQRLKQSGYDAISANSTFEAGLLVERYRPHVLLVDDDWDDDVPDMLSGLRCQSQCPDVKLVALAEPNGHAESADAGPFHARLTKPFNMNQLIDTLNNLA